MTKELEKEVEDYISHRPTEGTKDFVVYKVRVGENAFASVVEHKSELGSSDWIKIYEGTEQECYRVVGYLDAAELREKRIAELNNFIIQSKKDGISPINALIIKNLGNQLTKAKDLLLKFIELKNKPCAVGHSINMLLYENISAQTEQFLKDLEK